MITDPPLEVSCHPIVISDSLEDSSIGAVLMVGTSAKMKVVLGEKGLKPASV